MGIKSTCEITRASAIQRILKIDQLIFDKNYRELASEVCEGDSDIKSLLDDANPRGADKGPLSCWTDAMLGDQMDRPLYRRSMFDSYLVSG